MIADRARHGEHVLEIGRAIFVGRRAHGDEHDFRPLHRLPDVRREGQAAVALIAHDHRLEPGLVDRELVLLERADLAGIDVGAHHLVTRFREAGTHHETDVPRADDSYLQARSPLRSRASTWRVSTVARACRFTDW